MILYCHFPTLFCSGACCILDSKMLVTKTDPNGKASALKAEAVQIESNSIDLSKADRSNSSLLSHLHADGLLIMLK